MDYIAMSTDFLYSNICILCLESHDASYINIYSEEGKQLGVQEVIVKYFWLQPSEKTPKTRSICRRCWNSVYSFHEFYLQVERAHKRLGHEIPVVYCESIMEDPIGENVYIKDELDEKDEGVPPIHKAKRGKPRKRKQNTVTSGESKIDVNVKDEQTQLGSEGYSQGINDNEPYCSLANEWKTKCTNGEHGASSNCKRRSGRLQKHNDIESVREHIEEFKNETEPVEESNNLPKVKEIKIELTCQSEEQIDLTDQEKESKLRKEERVMQLDKWDEYIAKNFTLICSVCQIELPKFSTLKRHFRSEHQLSGYAICCNKKFFKRSHLNDHIKFHQNPETFKCPHCSKILSVRASLESHMKRHEEKRERKYQCETCLKRFFSKTIFTNHMLVHTPEEQKTVSCVECEKKFATQALLERHQKTVHQNVNAIVCDVCGKSLRGKEAFERHMDEHAGTVRPTHECEICGTTVKSKYNLTRHKRQMHSEANRTPQTCQICGKVSSTINVHRYHVYYVHKLQRTHACTFCDKSYKRAFKLKEHLKTHTGEGLYTCTYCSRTFNSKTNMYTHQKRIHPNEWAQNCPINAQKLKLQSKNIWLESNKQV